MLIFTVWHACTVGLYAIAILFVCLSWWWPLSKRANQLVFGTDGYLWWVLHCVTRGLDPPKQKLSPNISPNSDAAILLLCDAFNVMHAMHASTVLAVIIPSVCLFVVRLSHTCFATISNNALQYFDTTRNGNHSSFLTPTAVGRQCSLRSEICAQSDPPLRKTPTLTDFRT